MHRTVLCEDRAVHFFEKFNLYIAFRTFGGHLCEDRAVLFLQSPQERDSIIPVRPCH